MMVLVKEVVFVRSGLRGEGAGNESTPGCPDPNAESDLFSPERCAVAGTGGGVLPPVQQQ